jgi:hypothetical protein
VIANAGVANAMNYCHLNHRTPRETTHFHSFSGRIQ